MTAPFAELFLPLMLVVGFAAMLGSGGALLLLGAGFALFVVAKVSLFRRGVWIAWGSRRMTRGFRVAYRTGYVLMVLGLIAGLPSLRLRALAVHPNASSERECTREDAALAEGTADGVRTWAELRASFQRFPGCDDGVIAASYSDFVASALATDWASVSELQSLAAEDPRFRAFVLRHLDPTAHPEDLSRTLTNARAACPADARELCAEIQSAATAAQATR